MDRNEAGILRLKKERVFEVQIQFYSQGICQGLQLISCLHQLLLFQPFFLVHFDSHFHFLFFSCFLLSLPFLFFLFFPFLCFSLLFSFFIFPCPLLGKGVSFHLEIILSSLHHSSTKFSPSIGLILSNIRVCP